MLRELELEARVLSGRLDADAFVRECMSDKGYSFATIHSPTDYADAKCYKGTPTNRATAPVFSKCQF